MRPWARRAAATLAATVAVVVGTALPADAHTVSGAGAGNYRTTLTGVSPAIPGVTVRVVENGSRLSLANTTAQEAVVLGYEDEPYLRVGPDGVFENVRSPATYLNASRTGRQAPPTADAKAAPQWRRVSTGHTALWHDHRIHWMGTTPPPVVKAAPSRYHLIDEWTVPFTYDGVRHTVGGTLAWVPGPSPAPWRGLAVVAFGVVVLAGRRRRVATVAAATALLVAVDMVHTIGIAAVNAGPWTVAAKYLLTSSGVSVLAWVVGAVSLAMTRRRPDDAMYLAAFAGASIALLGGAYDTSTLSASTPPFALSPVVARACVALSLGVGLGVLAVVAQASLRRRRAVAA
ncbi:MAG: hypothetical protein QOE45_213 [Frankiaceae bacterium]|jgi:hypothetical protein|nr:hypothetical protein [Frankiaceae bacterium]